MITKLFPNLTETGLVKPARQLEFGKGFVHQTVLKINIGVINVLEACNTIGDSKEKIGILSVLNT